MAIVFIFSFETIWSDFDQLYIFIAWIFKDDADGADMNSHRMSLEKGQ